jgi:anti-sigma regulatory factor (Ser/Thr protein kinase)
MVETITLRNDLGEIRRVQDRFESAAAEAKLPQGVVHAIVLALEEMLANVIEHAYPKHEAHTIDVTLTIEERQVTVEIVDGGAPFDPLDVPAPDTSLGIMERTVGGLGIHLVKTMMTDVRYRRDGGRNVLTLMKTFGELGE